MKGAELHLCRGMSEREEVEREGVEREGARAGRGSRVKNDQTEFNAITVHHLALQTGIYQNLPISYRDILSVGFTTWLSVIEEDTAGSQCHEYVPDGKRRTQVGRPF